MKASDVKKLYIFWNVSLAACLSDLRILFFFSKKKKKISTYPYMDIYGA